jgi:hypothetical protein
MKRILSQVTVLVIAASAQATFYYDTKGNSGFANAGIVPDNNYSGWTDTRTLSGVNDLIDDIWVTLNLANGWNGDLYTYLVHGGGFSVLLDRVGYPASSFGYGDSGFNVTLGTSANPIESYQSHSPGFNESGQLLGTWTAHSGLGQSPGVEFPKILTAHLFTSIAIFQHIKSSIPQTKCTP